MKWWLALLVIGVNFSVWGIVGMLRLLDEKAHHVVKRVRKDDIQSNRRVQLSDVAVLMAAHNEEMVIAASLASLAKLIPRENIHVVSDASTDKTVALVESAGANVIETPRNVGKATALSWAIRHFELLKQFRAVMVLDADTQLDRRYFEVALPIFDDPRVVAVAGCAHTRWQRHLSPLGNVIVSHRQRIYVLTQLLLKYGQTWRGISATHIVPGFASIYRSSALRRININPRGLVIEDFNMTFEIHAKRLGRIAFHPDARAYTQDPDRYRDYVKQMRRWTLGLWQTVRRSVPHRAVFAGTLALTLLELMTSSLMFLLLPPVLLVLGVAELAPGTPFIGAVAHHLTFADVGVGIALPDYLLTCAVAVLERRPAYLLAGLLFLPMKITDAAIALFTLPRAWLDRSTGQWVSPTRRAEPVVGGTDGTEVA